MYHGICPPKTEIKAPNEKLFLINLVSFHFFYFLNVVFEVQKFLFLIKFNLSFFSLMGYAFGVANRQEIFA